MPYKFPLFAPITPFTEFEDPLRSQMIADQHRYMVTNPRNWVKLLPLAKVKGIKLLTSHKYFALTFLNDLKQLSNGPYSKRNVYSIAFLRANSQI